MKKIINWGSLLLLFFLSLQSCASTKGNLSYDGRTLDYIDHKGSVELKNSTLNGNTQIEGSLDAQNSNFKGLIIKGNLDLKTSQINSDLNVEGSANLRDSLVRGASSFKGVATLKQSQLKGDVRIKGDQDSSILDSTLSSQLNFIGNELAIKGKSVLHNVSIEQSPEHPEAPVLTVDSGVTIEGDIQFLSLKGKVKLAVGAKLNGKVINGEIVQ